MPSKMRGTNTCADAALAEAVSWTVGTWVGSSPGGLSAHDAVFVVEPCSMIEGGCAPTPSLGVSTGAVSSLLPSSLTVTIEGSRTWLRQAITVVFASVSTRKIRLSDNLVGDSGAGPGPGAARADSRKATEGSAAAGAAKGAHTPVASVAARVRRASRL